MYFSFRMKIRWIIVIFLLPIWLYWLIKICFLTMMSSSIRSDDILGFLNQFLGESCFWCYFSFCLSKPLQSYTLCVSKVKTLEFFWLWTKEWWYIHFPLLLPLCAAYLSCVNMLMIESFSMILLKVSETLLVIMPISTVHRIISSSTIQHPKCLFPLLSYFCSYSSYVSSG
jgi:hypothetical protein